MTGLPSYTGVMLIPIKQYLDDHQKMLVDLEWSDGDPALKELLRKCIEHAQILIIKMNTYIPNF